MTKSQEEVQDIFGKSREVIFMAQKVSEHMREGDGRPMELQGSQKKSVLKSTPCQFDLQATYGPFWPLLLSIYGYNITIK